eukprot:TRINITY_DN8914_c0_g1_i1.p1 TRINITY_DN8914_c0_g1~~TRINITY_DN8914_c0_g1_i1.p1  ORF type:complete len:278 (-),score=49.63 TRINITY_DN8914_c0_g1_i1:27-839(-)
MEVEPVDSLQISDGGPEETEPESVVVENLEDTQTKDCFLNLKKGIILDNLFLLRKSIEEGGEKLKNLSSLDLASILGLLNSLECFQMLLDSSIIMPSSKVSKESHPILYFLLSFVNAKPCYRSIILYLLDKGADPTEVIVSRSKTIFLCYVAEGLHDEEIIDKMLGTKKIDLMTRDIKTGSSIFHLLARMEDNEQTLRLISKFLTLGLNIDIRDYEGKNALAEAIVFSRVETIKLLLAKGANPRLKDKFGYSSQKRAQIAPSHIKQSLQI